MARFTKLLETKRVLQDKQTKLYLKPDGKWTKRLKFAAHFKCIADVLAICEARGLTGVQLALRFEQSEYNSRFDFGC
jgi:hypothetical protein